MVLPLALLLAGGGSGLQMFGQGQRAQAQDIALNKFNTANQFAQAGQAGDTATGNAALTNLAGQSNASNAQAVQDTSAANMRGNFANGSDELQRSIAGVTAATPQAGADALSGAGDNVALMNALHRQKSSNDRRTEGISQVLENNAGLASMNTGVSNAMAAKSDRDMMIQNRINAIMKLQNYAQAVRGAALQKAGAEHGLDSARAATVGGGAMYLGALMGASAALANRPGGGQPTGGYAGSYGESSGNLGNTNPQV